KPVRTAAMSECLGQPELAIVRLRMRFEPVSPGRLEGYTGSAWRGGLGHELRRAVCRTGAPDCGGCPHLAECDYPLAFETPADGLLGKVDSAPRPFGLAALPTPLVSRSSISPSTAAAYGSFRC